MGDEEEDVFVEEKEEELDEESLRKVEEGVDNAFAKAAPSAAFSATVRYDFRYAEDLQGSSLPQGISAFKSLLPFSQPPPSAAQQLADLLSGTFPWQCSVCTLLNEPGSKVCSVCGASPPPLPSIPFPDLSSKPKDSDPSSVASSSVPSASQGDESSQVPNEQELSAESSSNIISNEESLFTIIKMKDCASFVSLRRETGLCCDTKLLGNSGPFFENWTITMDILLPQLPSNEPLPLLSCFHDPSHARSTKETVVYPNGSVGIFDALSDKPETWIKPGVWTRITIRYGPGDASNFSNRKLAIFVNGKKSIEIDKGIFHEPCGRFSIPSEGFLLFGGDIPEAEGVCVRYVDFTSRCITDSEVKTRLHSSVYSQWQQESASSEAQLFASKSLKPLYKRPPFVWEEIAYISEFGDAMVEGTGLDGASSILELFEFSLLLLQECFKNSKVPLTCSLLKSCKS